jgi:hypothetical protein
VSAPEPAVSVLGTRWSESERWKVQRTGFLGLRTSVVAAPPLRFIDWTVDGQPLRDRLVLLDGTPCNDITPVLEDEGADPFATAYLKALLGEVGVTSRPGRDPWVRYSDGRAALLFCPQCFGLDCGSVSAEIVVTESTVEWREVAYQDGMTESIVVAEVPSFSLIFDRSAYEATLRALVKC